MNCISTNLEVRTNKGLAEAKDSTLAEALSGKFVQPVLRTKDYEVLRTLEVNHVDEEGCTQNRISHSVFFYSSGKEVALTDLTTLDFVIAKHYTKLNQAAKQ